MTEKPPVSGLTPQLQALIDEFASWWSRAEKQRDAANVVRSPLYHYTDMGGLLGILSNEKLWFTSMHHLNDPSELTYGIGMALDIFDRVAKASTVIPVGDFCAVAKHVLIKSGGEIFGFYVASFSQADNDLAQWRSYADNGRGVAIGFAPSLFAYAADQSHFGPADKTLVTPVLYDRKQCERNFGEVIRRAAALVDRAQAHVTDKDERDAFRDELARQIAAPIFLLTMTCKHSAYAHERETRMLLANVREDLDPITQFRTRGPNLVPYVPSDFKVRKPGVITKIMVGPAAHDSADEAVRALLRKHGLSPDIVERSEIPYTAH